MEGCAAADSAISAAAPAALMRWGSFIRKNPTEYLPYDQFGGCFVIYMKLRDIQAAPRFRGGLRFLLREKRSDIVRTRRNISNTPAKRECCCSSVSGQGGKVNSRRNQSGLLLRRNRPQRQETSQARRWPHPQGRM